MSRKNKSVTLSLTAQEKAALEKQAAQFGCMWGDRPNVSAYIKLIAAGALIVNHNLPKSEVKRKRAAVVEKIKHALDELSVL